MQIPIAKVSSNSNCKGQFRFQIQKDPHCAGPPAGHSRPLNWDIRTHGQVSFAKHVIPYPLGPDTVQHSTPSSSPSPPPPSPPPPPPSPPPLRLIIVKSPNSSCTRPAKCYAWPPAYGCSIRSLPPASGLAPHLARAQARTRARIESRTCT